MPPPSKPTRPSHRGSGGDFGDHGAAPSNNLWVGNLSGEVTDAVLMELFDGFQPLDATSYGARGYGFVFFKRTEDAVAAKDSLQGADLKGSSIKIEFARPARACKHIWVGGISPDFSKEEFEEEFAKFGKIEDFKFVRERNTATVEYARLEDAIQAMRSMNGKELGGEQIRVDFLRSQPIRRELLIDGPDSREYHGRGMGPSDVHAGSKRPQPSQSSGFRRDGQPSNILWVGYPPSVQIDEQRLHNAMILFGEIERIKSFPSRNYSFVEFRSVDEARRAKEGLQGRLFNDPRITIMFSNSGLAPDRGQETYRGEHFQSPEMDGYVHSRPFEGNMQVRPFGPHNGYDPHSGAEFDDVDLPYGAREGSGKSLMGPSWRRPSPPASAMLPSSPSMRTSSGWDVYDGNQFQRDSKRSRIESSLPGDETSYPLRMIDDRRVGVDRSYCPAVDGIASGISSVHGRSRPSPLGSRFSPEPVQDADDDYIWRGLIAKGGTPVCHARCVPVVEGLILELPDIVNCSARTGLDTLAKHYAEAAGFDLVFFLPDAEEDFGSYTEFLRYLASKDRAGVAKLDDGTTLFLVPPSDFLRKVLKVVGPERLYGVVLKMPRPAPTSEPHQALAVPQYADRLRFPPPQPDYGLLSPREEPPVMPTDYGRAPQGDSNFPKPLYHPPPSESPAVHSASQNYVSTSTTSNPVVSQGGISLTPELIATLASLLPTNPQTSAATPAEVTQQQSFRPPLPPAAPLPNYQVPDHGGPSSQQPASQYIHSVSAVSQYQPYPSVSASASHSMQPVFSGSHIQYSSANAYQQAPISSRPLTNFPIPSQSGQFVAAAQVPQQQQVEVPPNSQRGYGVVQGNEVSGLYTSPAVNHNYSSSLAANQVQGTAGFSQLQAAVPPVYERTNAELSNQVQQLQATSSGAVPSGQDVDTDKNKRYQSTLQFAASLLQQIHQQPQ
ncbi:hypothetical protein CRG98_043325 [Punica granatum]|uniref:RRM domain-containing protein n=1 Tax=Punica granatum TaxID=22663 RepID=A0A2I0HX58_PUNGR|nr:hypothetical protein CRG98_043325 [Punica granatum]